MLAACVFVAVTLSLASAQRTTADYENCKTLGESRMQVAWTVRRDAQMIDFLLCGCAQDESQNIDVDDDVYMAFGLSESPMRTVMQGADVTVAWVNRMSEANAVDYHISGYIQCVAGAGACPDTLDLRGGCTNDVFDISGSRVDTKQCVAFSRNFSTSDDTCDLPIDPDNEEQYIVWAVGGLGNTAYKHFARASGTDEPIHLGRSPVNSCSTPLVCPDCPPFSAIEMDVRDQNATFLINIGPNALERGYMSIAGQPGWGNSIYINGTLIPRLRVVRGNTYTFICETGNSPDVLLPGGGNYHPFYITDSRVGGRLNSGNDRETVYAGFDDTDAPLGIGPYCEYKDSGASMIALDNCGSFQDYLGGLNKEACRTDDPPGVFTWTPDESTPDLVYYQCATHSSFGYEISVEDSAAVALTGSLSLLAIMLSATLLML
ncbi:protein Skeletor, isoforms B/C-like [Halichondria panicea]|uniref:protein Skeletor, isoforms B/C-like n=1 Tax=Halichondria panicea TaxID=6063 RepID=UPI00312B8F43